MGTYLGKHPLGVVVPIAYRYLEKKEIEGIDSVSIDDSIKAPIFDLQVGGNSNQKQYSGKNLFDISKAENGTIGSETGEDLGTNVYPNRCRSPFIYLTAGNYTISFKELISTGSFIHRYTSNNSNTWLGRINLTRNGNVSKFTLDIDCYIRFTIQPIDTSSSLVLNTETLSMYEPQLEKGSAATSYEPYVGGISSPNYAYPQTIDSVGDKTKNLVDVNSSTNTFGYLTKTGEVVNHTSIKYTDYISIPNNATKLTISGMGGAVFSLPATCFYDENKNFIVGEFFNESATRTITIPSGAKYFRTCFRTTHTKFMAEYNTTATDYEPYGYRIPIKAQGKNLFGNYETLENQYINASGTILEIQGINTYRYIPVEPNTTYTISGKSASKGYVRVAEYDENKTFIKRVYNNVMVNPTITITTTSTTKYLALCPDVNFTDGTVTNSHIYDIQIEKGSIATNYEPYIQPIATNIYLKEPLRKIGNYADILDYKNKKVVRNITSVQLTSDFNWVKYSGSDAVPNVYFANLGESIRQTNHSICSHFTYKSSVWAYGKVGEFCDHPSNSNKYFVTDKETVDEWKTWLDENDVILNFTKSIPTEETIEVHEISTLEGTTNLEIKTETKPSYITLIYGIDAY